jgi:hypothetical protein
MTIGRVRVQRSRFEQQARRANRLYNRYRVAANARIRAGPDQARPADFRHFYPEVQEVLDELLDEAAGRVARSDGAEPDIARLSVMDLAHLISRGADDDPTTNAAKQRLDRYAQGLESRFKKPTEFEWLEWLRANLVLIHLERRKSAANPS